jgi:hypothetical protein
MQTQPSQMNTKPNRQTQMQTHHLNIVEHQPLYGGDVLSGNRGEIWSNLEPGKVRYRVEGLLCLI